MNTMSTMNVMNTMSTVNTMNTVNKMNTVSIMSTMSTVYAMSTMSTVSTMNSGSPNQPPVPYLRTRPCRHHLYQSFQKSRVHPRGLALALLVFLGILDEPSSARRRLVIK